MTQYKVKVIHKYDSYVEDTILVKAGSYEEAEEQAINIARYEHPEEKMRYCRVEIDYSKKLEE